MKRMITQLVLSLVLIALVWPSAGCKPRRGGYGGGGSFTDIFVGGDFGPSFGGGGYEEFYQEDSFDSGYSDFGGYEESYYDEGFYDDDWKGKKPDRKP